MIVVGKRFLRHVVNVQPRFLVAAIYSQGIGRASLHSSTDSESDQSSKRSGRTLGVLGGLFVAGGIVFYESRKIFAESNAISRRVLQEVQSESSTPASLDPNDASFRVPVRKDLPVYRRAEVKSHGKNSQRIWVTFKNGVYDVTDFIESHPGGDKILMAAGEAVDPFWRLYAQHKTAEVMEILEGFRIGTLDPTEKVPEEKVDLSDPFSSDPKRHPALIVNNARPFNAETPPDLLIDHFRTPNDLFFVRNHLPVPQTDKTSHRVRVSGLGMRRNGDFSIQELKNKYPEVHVTSVVQCAGNRRADMQRYKKVAGLMWEGYAISNAKWTGVRLRDVLLSLGVDPNDKRIKHVHLEGADVDPTGKVNPSGTPYGASISFEKAMHPDTIIAYAMNDEEIPRDHGYPLRLIAPGIVGARQVKWLKKIHLSEVESPNHFQQKDYRGFSPSVQHGDDLKWETVPAIQEYPIQSAFCLPKEATVVDRGDGTVDVAGYAWSGGGRGIIRVEVSPDGGKNWYSAELEQDPEQEIDKMWAWTLFRASIPIPEEAKELDLVVKATDRSYNTQPETAAGIWNVRGLLHNAWHHVRVIVRDA